MSNDMLGKDALAELAGPQKDFAEKLGGSDGLVWWNAFKRFLRKENPWSGFPIWKTVKLGTPGLKTADDFRKAIQTNGFRIDDRANDILGKPAFKAATEETEVDLVNVSVSELGFKDGATREQIYSQAKELGMDLCPAEVGPQLRLQYKDQPKGEWLLVAMEPITDSDSSLHVFLVGRDDSESWLHSSYGYPDGFGTPGTRLVFVRSRE